MSEQFAIPGLQELRSPVSESLLPFLTLPPHSVATTRWKGIESIGPVTNNGVLMPNPIVSARMVFSRKRITPDVTPSLTLSSAEGNIVIAGDTNWLLEVPPQALPLGMGSWYWSFTVTDTTTDVYKLFDGSILITS